MIAIIFRDEPPTAQHDHGEREGHSIDNQTNRRQGNQYTPNYRDSYSFRRVYLVDDVQEGPSPDKELSRQRRQWKLVSTWANMKST